VLPAPRIPRGGSDHDPSLHQPHQLVYLLGIVASVGHGHDDDVRLGAVDAVANGVGRARPHIVDDRTHVWIGLGELLDEGDGGVVRRIDHDHDLTEELDCLTQPDQNVFDPGTLVVGRNDHGDSRLHTTTPLPRRFQMSTTGCAIGMSA